MWVLRFVPVLGPVVAFLFACLVDSYYLFENHWLKSNWSFAERVKNVETRYSYHLGFGLPITFASWWWQVPPAVPIPKLTADQTCPHSSDPISNLALFALCYPICQLLTAPALPLPLDPSSPASGGAGLSFAARGKESFSMAAAEGGEEARGRKGHPGVPVRLPVLWVPEKVYEGVSGALGGLGGRKKDAGYGQGGSTAYGNVGGGGYGPGAGAGGYGAGGGGGYAQPGYGAQPTFGAQPGYGAPQQAYKEPPPPQQYPTNPAANTGSLNGGGWRTDYGSAGPPISVPGGAGYGAQATPPRRGHAQNSSLIGVGAEYAGGQGGVVDRKLDSLISEAARRKKGE